MEMQTYGLQAKSSKVANIHLVKTRMAELATARIGYSVWVRGVKYLAHIDDSDLQADSGHRIEMIATFKKTDAVTFNIDDKAIINTTEYKIRRIQKVSQVDPFIEVELKKVEN